MSRVVPDAELLAKLSVATKAVEIADENGNVIGHFLPNAAYDRIMSFVLPPATKEEIAEARAEMLAHGGVSTQELLAGLDEIKRQWEARQ
ncbi:hypothetical protein [Frigoriglobus tundricola]|uniref:Uncharacterized protein n=1 Tax=Frigoriglobus tundricola TaxID=2774151 RepID=A0A6M5YM32_9BACT|nr:hypothetical protein [Frigoriglobus tundricola]QJW94363.1 hypothetical protein FTUN_1883 [Frigoriglobus tundricola]